MILPIFLLIVGLIILVVGADYFIASSSLIAKRFGIPKLIIGLTVVALGTSAPELGVNIVASLNGHGDISLGNILGSNISNLLLIFGIAALFAKKIHISRDSLTQISLMTMISLLLLAIALIPLGPSYLQVITQLEGLALIFLGLFYWFYLFRITKEDEERLEGEDISDNQLKGLKSIRSIVAVTLASILALLFGSNLVTTNAVILATALGIPELMIAGTVVALGTSLPELVTSLQAIKQKHYDLMLGNVVGSNIMNTLFILGASTLIQGVLISQEAITYLIINVLASVFMLIGFTLFEVRVFKRWQAIVLLALYVAFIATNIGALLS